MEDQRTSAGVTRGAAARRSRCRRIPPPESRRVSVLSVEERGIPDVDARASARVESRAPIIGAVEGGLEFAQDLLLEVAGAVEPTRLIEIDILIEREVKGIPPLEVAIRAAVADRQRDTRSDQADQDQDPAHAHAHAGNGVERANRLRSERCTVLSFARRPDAQRLARPP